MSRSFRIFLIAYAAAMFVCMASLGKGIFHDPGDAWSLIGFAIVSYLALACGYSLVNDRDRAPGGIALAIVFVAALSLSLAVYLGGEPIKSNLPFITLLISVPAYLACAGLLLRRLKRQKARLEATAWQPGILVVVVAGAALVLASLATNTTTDTRGWRIIAFSAKWITSEVNVATGISGPEIPWLQPFYKPGGYLFYSLSLFATVAILIRLLLSHMSLNRARESRLFITSLLVINISSFWVLTDIFWGWHFDFSDFPSAAAIATALWLAGPLFVIILIVPLAWKKDDLWRLRALLVLQVPIAAFNMAMIATYWDTALRMPGLGLLIIGLLVESLACIEILASRSQVTAAVHELRQGGVQQTRSVAA